MILILLLMISAVIVPASAAAGDKGSFKKKTVTAYLFNKKDTEKISCLFFDDMPNIPYISADDYLNQIYTVEFSTEDNRNGTYTVKCANGEMLVDTVKDTVRFDDLESILYYDSVDANEEESGSYIDWEEDDYQYIGEHQGVDLDLGKYHLDIVGEGGKAYFPLYTISDMFSDIYLSAIYRGGNIYFIRTQDDDPYYDDSEIYSDIDRDQDMIDFTYNELCFAIDNFYGMPPKAEIAKDIENKGFDDAISEYDANTARAKTLLQSDSRVDFCKGMMILDNYFDDGGHTLLCGGLFSNINSDSSTALGAAVMESMNNIASEEDGLVFKPIIDMANEQSSKSSLSALKEDAFDSIERVKKWDDASFYCDGNTGYFVFDEFKDAVIKPFKSSLDYCVENNIKNFVIDVTTNGGGSQSVVFYILSAICGNSALYQINTLTGNRYKEDPKVDKNLDGKFDNKDDALKYDLNFAVMTTKHSFSSANMLPCIAQKNGVAVIGETSGGGTCALAMRFAPDGSFYYMSSDMKLTYSDGMDIDAGAKPDIEINTSDGYDSFFDFGKIESDIESYYKNKSSATEAETEPQTESETKNDEQPSSEAATIAATEGAGSDETTGHSDLTGRTIASDMTLLYVIIGTMAAVLIVIIALIVILIRNAKKKKTADRNPYPAINTGQIPGQYPTRNPYPYPNQYQNPGQKPYPYTNQYQIPHQNLNPYSAQDSGRYSNPYPTRPTDPYRSQYPAQRPGQNADPRFDTYRPPAQYPNRNPNQTGYQYPNQNRNTYPNAQPTAQPIVRPNYQPGNRTGVRPNIQTSYQPRVQPNTPTNDPHKDDRDINPYL